MDSKPGPLTLVEMDDPTAKASPTPAPDDDITLAPTLDAPADATIDLKPVERAVPITHGPAVKVDPYAQQAAREYAQGHVDQPLWDRAIAQAQGDRTAAAAIYVRSRGTALRLFDRDRRTGATQPLPTLTPDAPAPDRRRVTRRAAFTRYRTPALGALALLAIAATSVYYLLPSEPPGPAGPAVVQAAAPTSRVPAPRDAVNRSAATPGSDAPGVSTGAGADAARSLALLRTKIDTLRAAGNWNVLVLHAVEWTRREPTSAAAWDELRAGYVHLRQYDDALAAAKTAVRLAPDDPALRRHVGEVQIALDDPAAALVAFREAVARDGNDVASLQAIGLLAARLGQPQEVKVALDRALAVQPGDTLTTCLRQGLTQLAPARDGYTALRQVSAVDEKCRGHGDRAAVALQ